MKEMSEVSAKRRNCILQDSRVALLAIILRLLMVAVGAAFQPKAKHFITCSFFMRAMTESTFQVLSYNMRFMPEEPSEWSGFLELYTLMTFQTGRVVWHLWPRHPKRFTPEVLTCLVKQSM
jgi:hypothetical protein